METYRVEAWDIMQYLFKVKKINNHILHFYAEFSSKLDVDKIKQAVNLFADIFPLVRCGFDKSHAIPVWTDMGHTADKIVSLINTDNPAESARHFLCQNVSLKEGPQMKIGIIRSSKTDTLCVLINHMLCDAAGFKEVLYILASIYTSLENQAEIHIGSMVKDRSVNQIIKKYPFPVRFKIFFSKGNLNPSGTQKFDFEGCLSNPFIEIRKIHREKFKNIKAYAKSRNASINDVMMTAFIRVLFHIFGYTAALPCAIDLRRFLPNRKADSICNMMTNICCDIGPYIGENFDDTLLKVKQKMDFQKTNINCIKNIFLLETLFNVFPYKTATGILKKYFSNPTVAFTNIGVLDKKRLAFGTAEMTWAFMTGSIKYSPNFQVSLSTYDDEAALCVNLYGTQADRCKIGRFLDDFITELQNII